MCRNEEYAQLPVALMGIQNLLKLGHLFGHLYIDFGLNFKQLSLKMWALALKYFFLNLEVLQG